MKYLLTCMLLTMLAGCNSDFASPFDKPDETTQPVHCNTKDCA